MNIRTAIALLLAAIVVAPARGQKKEDGGAAIVRLGNAFRKSQKLPPLAINDKLVRAAQKHAENMARQDKYGDDNRTGHVLDGKNEKDRVAMEGYTLPVSENVGGGAGAADPVQVAARLMKAWENSPGHRRSLLDKTAFETGAGLARGKSGRWYACQLFGLRPVKTVRLRLGLDNRAGHAVSLRIKGSNATLTIPAATAGEVLMDTVTPDNPVLEVLPEKDTGKVGSVRVKSGGRYVITSDGKDGHKIEEAK
jgi:hypothetical protein